MPDESELLAKQHEIETALRDVGLYIDKGMWLPVADESTEDEDPEVAEARRGAQKGSRILVLECLLGDVAFTARVQDPPKVDIDAEVRKFQREMMKGEWEALQKEVREDEENGEAE